MCGVVYVADRERGTATMNSSVLTVKPTVFVVDDEPEMRNSLRWLIESVGLPVETFESGLQFLDHIDATRPGCVVLDVRMPDIGGLEVQQRLIQTAPALPIIIISAYADVPMAIRALENGAVYFLEKPFSDQLLLDRVHEALATNAVRRRERKRHDEVEAKLKRLTPRERAVLELVVGGLPNKEIARTLSLSEKTIEVHRAHVMQKMDAGSVAELVRMTYEHVTPPSTN